MRSIAAGMSPAKIAIAVAVTIAPSAGTGDMKKVTGTRSAVAIVAVRPGIAPTNMPKAADAKITQMTKGSKTRPSAVTKASMAASLKDRIEPAAGQRHAHQVRKEVLDQDRRPERDRQRHDPAHAEAQEQRGEDHEGAEDEADGLRGQDVEQDGDEDEREREPLARVGGPGVGRQPALAGALRLQAAPDEERAADDEPGAEQAREQRRAVFLAREGREARRQRDHDRGEDDEDRPVHGVVGAHLFPSPSSRTPQSGDPGPFGAASAG